MLGPDRPPLPGRQLLVIAVAAAVAASLYPLSVVRNAPLVTLILASPEMPAGAVVQQDFPGEQLATGFGHDGQYFYVIAREPLDPADAAEGLDRPRYRLQRILFPLLSWLLHPSPGRGLVLSMVAVGLAAVALGTFATGALLDTLGGRWHLAGLFAALPGTYWSLRLTTSDSLALALAIAAVTLSLRNRHGWATAVATAAVLTKEPIWLVLLGVAIWRRDRAGVALVSVPAAVAAAWFVLLHITVEDVSQRVVEFTWPGRGYLDAWRYAWSSGEVLDGALLAVMILGLGMVALRRHGLSGPLGWSILLHLLLFTVMSASVIALPDNNSRTMGPLLLLAIVALLTPAGAMQRPADSTPDSTAATSDHEQPSSHTRSSRSSGGPTAWST
jgi:hypothetical protein